MLGPLIMTNSRTPTWGDRQSGSPEGKMMKIGFLGGGRMAQALANGFIKAGLTRGEYMVASCAPDDQISADSFKKIGAEVTSKNDRVVEKNDVVILAVKPSVVPVVLKDIYGSFTKNHLLLSIAMGVSIQRLEKGLPNGSRVIRAMPNTAAVVGEAASVYVRGSAANTEDGQLAHSLLSAVGTCHQVPEQLLDPVTALSGSGPAYIYTVIEALGDGAVRMGMPRDLAYRLASQTVVGAGQMVLRSGHPALLKDNVTSPAGSTAEGLYCLEQNRVRAAFIAAIEKATERCKQVSQELNK